MDVGGDKTAVEAAMDIPRSLRRRPYSGPVVSAGADASDLGPIIEDLTPQNNLVPLNNRPNTVCYILSHVICLL